MKLYIKHLYMKLVSTSQNFLESEYKVIVNKTKAASVAIPGDAVEDEFNNTVVLENLASEWRMADITSDDKTRVGPTESISIQQNVSGVQVYSRTEFDSIIPCVEVNK